VPTTETPQASPNLARQIWQSILRTPISASTDRQRKRVVRDHIITHSRPIRVSAATLRYTHTWGLGGMSLVLVSMLMATGILLMFAYQPVPGGAYQSIVRLEQEVGFGQLVRNVHHWSANLLVFIVGLHLLRVFFTGAVQSPRQFNWIIGLCLLAGILLSNFTGYLLPWDQLSYWAITISTGMIGYIPGIGSALQNLIRGGSEIGSATLLLFYTIHTTVIPALLALGMALHFWRVRKAGGVVIPEQADEEFSGEIGHGPKKVLFVPNLLIREFSVGLILVAVVLLFSATIDAGLGDPANPGMSPNPAKAPWYFVGLQELLLHFHPTIAVLLVPLLAIGFLLAIPYLRFDSASTGIWFFSKRGRQIALWAAGLGVVTTLTWIVLDERLGNAGAWMTGVPPIVSGGIIPLFLWGVAITAGYRIVNRKYARCNNESIQGLFAFLFTVFVTLTVIGVWFRGTGMSLTLPWSS